MEANILTLQTLFGSDVSYRIPQFQRPYAWKKDDQWKPLWEDVHNLTGTILSRPDRKVPPHFMGAIVLQSQESGTGEVVKRIVVDGQQRLTTLQLLIRAAQDAFQSLNDTERANRLSELTLNTEDHWGGDSDNQTKIRQSNLNDQRAFQEAIRGSSDGHGSLRAIGEAFEYFKGVVMEWLNEEPAIRVGRSNALEEALTKYLQIAAIDLDDGEKPHFIFAVLNTRAEPLKESDHIKNTVMYEADVIDDAHKAGELWGMFDNNDWWRQETKEGRLNRIHLDRFLNYWIVVRTQEDITSDRVSARFSSYVESARSSIEDITADIRKAGLIYQDMEEARYPGIETFLRRMKTMELGAVMPPLLWLYTNEVPEEERNRSIKALESFLVRRMLCGLGSQGLNRLFIELVGRLEARGADRVDESLVGFLNRQTVENRIWPKDGLLAENLIQKPLRGSTSRQRMVLEAIEIAMRSDKTNVFEQFRNLTIEHLMPQSWERNWPLPQDVSDRNEASEVRNRAIKEIGNLTLVTDKLNPSLSNDPWGKKKETLAQHTALRLNWELLNPDPEVWDEEAIYARSEELHGRILKIWPHADLL